MLAVVPSFAQFRSRLPAHRTTVCELQRAALSCSIADDQRGRRASTPLFFFSKDPILAWLQADRLTDLKSLKGLSPQTRRHAMIASMLGIRQAVLAVNKIDLVDFSRQRFEELTEQFGALTKGLRFSAVTAIPVSARRGDNITSASPAMPWYRGPSLLEYLETVDIEEEAVNAPLRLPVQSVIRPNPDFRGYAGLVASGCVRPGRRSPCSPAAGRRP